MNNMQGRTVFITGGSRGIGRAIALKAAQAGANVVIAAKTEVETTKLTGTIYSVAEEIEAAGGKALPLLLDVRDEQQIHTAIQQAAKAFGGIEKFYCSGIHCKKRKKSDVAMCRNKGKGFCAKNWLSINFEKK